MTKARITWYDVFARSAVTYTTTPPHIISYLNSIMKPQFPFLADLGYFDEPTNEASK